MDQKNVEQSSLESLVDRALAGIDEAFSQFTADQLFLSFNGGKDCTVLLDIVSKYMSSKSLNRSDITYVYVQPEHPFEAVEQFVLECEKLHNIKMQIYKGDLKSTLENVLKINSKLKGCFMGQRRTDPFCNDLSVFQETDRNWPKLIRINPLLEWTCDNIWQYLISNNVPYCSLYDVGYTSLGDMTNTIPNKNLQYIQDGQVKYKAAYELKDDKLERAGRLK